MRWRGRGQLWMGDRVLDIGVERVGVCVHEVGQRRDVGFSVQVIEWMGWGRLRWGASMQYAPRAVTPSCPLSRRPCQGRTTRSSQWLRTAPTEEAARPALGTHCPGTWGRHSGVADVEGAPGAMGVSWTLRRGQSSALQVMRWASSVQRVGAGLLTEHLLCAGV